jgi:regulator of replication initiation timing
VLVAMAAAIAYLAVQNNRLTTRHAETQLAEEMVREQFGAALQSIAEIQDSLSVIVPAEERLASLSRNAELSSSITQTQKDQMLGTIADLKLSVGNTKQKIEDLEKTLQSSQTEMAGLRRVIDNLKRSVAEREATIQQLTGEVASLTSTVAVLQTDVQRGQEKIAEQEGVIETKTKELGTVYYVIGTKDELKAKGIITEKGGLIGIGKTPQLTAAFNEGDFTTIDTNVVSEIPLTGTKPQVLSAQNKTSYEFRLLADQQSKLVIKDPIEFRKVKYVVVMVEKK